MTRGTEGVEWWGWEGRGRGGGYGVLLNRY